MKHSSIELEPGAAEEQVSECRLRWIKLCQRLGLTVVSVLLMTLSVRPQSGGLGLLQVDGGPWGQRMGEAGGPAADRDRDPFADEKRLRALNADRQKAMVSDAAKLLRLVTELNEEIGREKPDSLTADEGRKLAEIEKLARSVKEKMKTSVRMPSVAPLAMPGQYP